MASTPAPNSRADANVGWITPEINKMITPITGRLASVPNC